jgi:hypothetical protein
MPNLNNTHPGSARCFCNLSAVNRCREKENLIGSYSLFMSMMRIKVCIKSRVQGVGYRYFVSDCAGSTGEFFGFGIRW